MIDFHCHALPGIDDGSRNIKESLEMLELSAKQGITVMALTPHFYADRDTPEHFLERRAIAMEHLFTVKKQYQLKLLAGAEVHYFPGLQRTDAIYKLRLENTPYLLVEMPFRPWTERMVNELLELNQKKNIVVVLAHIDRYLSMQKPYIIKKLLEGGIQLQANAESFVSWRQRRRMLRLMKQGSISFLGSDCHNMTSRRPCIDKALKIIAKKFGLQFIEALEAENELAILGDKVI